MLGLLSTIIRGREQADLRIAYDEKIAQAIDLTSLNTNNVNFCTRSRLYQREASRPSGPCRVFFWFLSPPPTPLRLPMFLHIPRAHEQGQMCIYGFMSKICLGKKILRF